MGASYSAKAGSYTGTLPGKFGIVRMWRDGPPPKRMIRTESPRKSASYLYVFFAPGLADSYSWIEYRVTAPSGFVWITYDCLEVAGLRNKNSPTIESRVRVKRSTPIVSLPRRV